MPALSQRPFTWTGAIDRLGIIASTVCFIHCLVTPILFSLLAVYAHFLPSEEHTHRVLAVSVTLLGAIAILTGYRRHRKPSVLLFMGTGLLCICTGAFFGDSLPAHWMEVLVTFAGSCCLIVAHRKNHTFCRSCVRCK